MPTTPLWPLVIYFFLVIALVAGLLGISSLLGQKHRQRATGKPYESEMPLTGSARMRLDVKFYLVAVFFVIFDLEAVFIFSWAVALREVGWLGYLEVVLFIGILFAGLVYLWRVGAIDLKTPKQRQQNP